MSAEMKVEYGLSRSLRHHREAGLRSSEVLWSCSHTADPPLFALALLTVVVADAGAPAVCAPSSAAIVGAHMISSEVAAAFPVHCVALSVRLFCFQSLYIVKFPILLLRCLDSFKIPHYLFPQCSKFHTVRLINLENKKEGPGDQLEKEDTCSPKNRWYL
jgi:hypothetical protein